MGALGIFALLILIVTVVAVLGAVVWLAVLPGKIAARRRHPQAEAVQVAGWLGILTGVVWILAMIWAYTTFGTGEQDDDGFGRRVDDLERRLAQLEGGGS